MVEGFNDIDIHRAEFDTTPAPSAGKGTVLGGEIIEFAADQLLGLNMQKSGIVDTMWDLIVDAIGGLVGAIMGYFYLKGGDSLIIQRLVEKFVRANFKSKEKADEIFDEDIKDID